MNTLKTMTMTDALKMGYSTVRAGFHHYIPVALPRDAVMALFSSPAVQDALYSQFSGVTQPDPGKHPSAPDDERNGRFIQTIQVNYMPPGHDRFIVSGYYSEQNGIEEWDIYGAVEVQ
jgi:hypothetical protein